jgi:hypothetical protein
MPTAKKKINRREQREYSEALSDLCSIGVEIDPDEVPEIETDLIIEGWGPESYREIFNMYEVRSGVVIGIRLLARRRGVRLHYFDIEFPWQAERSLIFPRVTDKLGDWRVAKGVAFERQSVLNSRIDDGLSLCVGQPVEGLIIGVNGDPIPKKYTHGSPVEIRLTLIDQFSNEYSADMELRINLKVGGKFSDLVRKEAHSFMSKDLPSGASNISVSGNRPTERLKIPCGPTKNEHGSKAMNQ